MDIRQYMSQLFERGEDPYGLTGKRDDTMEMLLAMMGQREAPQEWGLQDEMLVEDQVNPPAPPPAQNSWEAFQAMNPDLDYAAVARQAGGTPGSFPVENEFGGAISEMPSSPEQQAQVRDLMDYVQNQIPQDEANRMLDKRSRAYDPPAAREVLAASALAAEQRSQKFIEDISTQSGDQSGGRISPKNAMALMNAGMRVPASAIDRTLSSGDYFNEVADMRASAISFLQKVKTNPATMASDDSELMRLYNHNDMIYRISMKYPDDPERAYREIMALDLGSDGGEVDGALADESKQGVWSTKEDGTEVFTAKASR